MSDLSDSTFGKYRLIAELGHGGMADVFLAVARGPEGLGFSKLLVIKRLRANLAEDPDFISMLIDEARVAARLNHPNCIQTYEIGEIGNDYFISMEFLDGQPLHRLTSRARKKNGGFSMPLQLSIMCDVLTGLHHAHELCDYDGSPLGVVHRDVTPHNVFVTYDGQVKVVDFGIAKAAGRSSETRQGIIKGKVAYMAPEQAAGLSVDRRADVFSVGIMLWEAVVGERIWSGLDELTMMNRLISQQVPSSVKAVNPELPDEIDRIIQKALAANVEDRYATAEALSMDIEAFLQTMGRRPSTKELGAFTAQLFEDKKREARQIIEDQLAELKQSATLEVRKIEQPTDSSNNLTPSASITFSDAESSDPIEATVIKNPPTFAPDPMSTPDPLPILPLAPTLSTLRSLQDDADRASSVGSPPKRPRKAKGKTRGKAKAPPVAEPFAFAKRRPVAVAAVAVGVCLVTLGLMSRMTGPTPAATSTGSAPAVIVTSPTFIPPSPEIAVRLKATPSTAAITVDGKPVANPYMGRLPRDSAHHKIVVIAPGFRQDSRDVTYDTDVDWEATLQRERPGIVASVVPPPETPPPPNAPHVNKPVAR